MMSRRSHGRFARTCAALVVVCLAASKVHAQKLSIQGDRFAVDGTPKFLTFLSYFGAMGAPHVVQDLHFIRSAGFDGVRIWPNLDTGPQLMNGDGSLRPAELSLLRSILDTARLEHLMVDVTFTYEHIAGMTPATALVGIVNATNALRSYDNLLFDIQNERNVGDRRFMSETDVGRIFNAVKAVDPARITSASNALGDDWGPQWAADFTARLGMDVTLLHETRASDWYTLPVQQRVITTLRTNGRPAYMQEPMTTRDTFFGYPSNDRAEYFLEAYANAKLSGAAAWCFHTQLGVAFNNGEAPYFEDRLRAYPDLEWGFIQSLNARVILRANDGVHYVVPLGGGGGTVRADRSVAGPGSWEIFAISKITGGALISGDRIAFGTADGSHYLQAVNGGGSSLSAASQSIGSHETFTIETSGGGIIRHGDAVALRVADTSWYVSAEGGGGGNVSVNGTSPGASQTFTVLITTPHSSDIAPGGSLPFAGPGGSIPRSW